MASFYVWISLDLALGLTEQKGSRRNGGRCSSMVEFAFLGPELICGPAHGSADDDDPRLPVRQTTRNDGCPTDEDASGPTHLSEAARMRRCVSRHPVRQPNLTTHAFSGLICDRDGQSHVYELHTQCTSHWVEIQVHVARMLGARISALSSGPRTSATDAKALVVN